jgi:hypothetical protein
LQVRDFYGVSKVLYDAKDNCHRLFHGTTLHGQQSLEPALRREPSTYFTRTGPIGQVFEAAQSGRPEADVAVLGLGAGTLAAYARSGETWRFFEVDPAVVRIARDPHYFTYLTDSPARSLLIVMGDARLRLRNEREHRYRLIVIDAFSSDAPPVHLLTLEAVRLYRSRLSDGGLIAFNLPLRNIDLEPVVAALADRLGMVCRVRRDLDLSSADRRLGKQASIWAVLTDDVSNLGVVAKDPRWILPATRRAQRVWTDDYSDLAAHFRRCP